MNTKRWLLVSVIVALCLLAAGLIWTGRYRLLADAPTPGDSSSRSFRDKESWDELISRATGGLGGGMGHGSVVEAQRRVIVALKASDQSATALGNKIWWLNVWLLIFTVVICALTIVQAYAAWKTLPRTIAPPSMQSTSADVGGD